MRKLLGMTLIELLVVLTIIATLLSIAVPHYSGSVDRAKEAALREDLATMRDAIDKYKTDTGRYPDSLDVLVNRKYLRKVPVDPVTDSETTWLPIPPRAQGLGKVADVRSGAPGEARDGTKYKDW